LKNNKPVDVQRGVFAALPPLTWLAPFCFRRMLRGSGWGSVGFDLRLPLLAFEPVHFIISDLRYP
jgi:hypothetical protein